MRLKDSYSTATLKEARHRLTDLAYIKSERDAAEAAPALIAFATSWMRERDYRMGLACLDLLCEKKCPPGGKMLMRQDGVTPSIIHDLSQALYSISLIEAGYDLPDAEMLPCLNFMHDLPEEFDVTEADLKDKLHLHNAPLSDRTDLLAILIENMTKSRGGVYKYPNNRDYFNKVLEHPTTVIAKFQDRIHNMATLIGVKKTDRHRDYIVETMELRDTLEKAQSLFPDFTPVFDIMKRIVSTQIYYNVLFLNKVSSGNPIAFKNGSMPRLRRIAQLPEGLDPLKITEARAESKLRGMAPLWKPAPPI